MLENSVARLSVSVSLFPSRRSRAWPSRLLATLRGAREVSGEPARQRRAVVTLALGIGANATVTGLVHSILLRPLPFAEPDRLISLSEYELAEPDTPRQVSVPNFFDWRHNRSFAQLAAYYRWKSSLTGGGRPERLWVGLVSASLFDVLRVPPELGRTFTAPRTLRAESRRWSSAWLWQRPLRRSGGRPGRSLVLDGKLTSSSRHSGELRLHKFLPRPPIGPTGAELGCPLPTARPRRLAIRFLNVVGRLRPGVSLAAARAEDERLGRTAWRGEHPDNNKGRGILLNSLHERLVGSTRTALLMLLASRRWCS